MKSREKQIVQYFSARDIAKVPIKFEMFRAKHLKIVLMQCSHIRHSQSVSIMNVFGGCCWREHSPAHTWATHRGKHLHTNRVRATKKGRERESEKKLSST